MTINSSENPTFLNSRSRQAVIAMSEKLDANASPDYGFPSHPSSSVGADLDSGFDIDIAGLTSTLHKKLVDVSRILSLSEGR